MAGDEKKLILHRTVTKRQAEKINTNEDNIGTLALLNTSAKDTLVNAINEILSSSSSSAQIGDLNDLTTTDKTTIVNAINEIDANVGELTTLTTTDQSSVVNSINEIDGDVGDLTTLTTINQNSIVEAMNSLITIFQTVSCEANNVQSYYAPLCCGNNNIQGIETCDDGNQVPGDGCNSNCKLELVALSTIASPSPDISSFMLNGINSNDNSGTSVSFADINADGLSDVIVGAPGADPGGNTSAGETYVIYGTKEPMPSTFDLSSLTGINGFIINGAATGDESGTYVNSAGDFNGDGVSDIAIGAPAANSGAGVVYLVFSQQGVLPSTINLATLNGIDGITINGITAGDAAGTSVGNAGDFNGDGFSDIIIGAPGANTNTGEAYVIFGSDIITFTSINLSSLDGDNGVVFQGQASGDATGTSVSSAGDFNGDGIDDILIGSPTADPNGNTDAGETSLILGKTSAFSATINLSTADARFCGNTISGESGTSVNSAGDFNNDGINDIVIGAPKASPGAKTNAGETHIVFGTRAAFTAPFDLVALEGTNGLTLNGITAGDESGIDAQCAGDVNKDGISDIIIGAHLSDPGGNLNAGESYVVFGSSSSPFPHPFELSTINGDNGFAIQGIDSLDFAGKSVSSAGDFNGDGLFDVIIGSSAANGGAGESYVLFGHL